jgi:hypothetical protein
MFQLPLDIWELILVLIPPKEVHRLRSLNASFLSKALDYRYSTVRFDTLPSWTFNHLAMTSKLRLSAQVARLLFVPVFYTILCVDRVRNFQTAGTHLLHHVFVHCILVLGLANRTVRRL